jgi:hypothetical protein
MDTSAISKTFRSNRPTLGDGSIRTYTSIISNLCKQLDYPKSTPDFLANNYTEIIKHLGTQDAKNRKTRLSACIVYLEKCKGADKAVEAFRSQMMEDGKKANEEAVEQKLTEKQEENMIEWKEVQEKYNELEEEVKPIMKKFSLDKNQFRKVQLYVLLSCLTLIPPRRSLDYTEFKIRGDIDEKKDNFMEAETTGKGKNKVTKYYFVFNCYKTNKSYGQQREEIPEKLVGIMKEWMRLNQHEYLLMNVSQTAKISPVQLAIYLNDFFQKNISTSMLRHIYLTNKYKNIPALKELNATASSMGHSTLQMLEYIKK